MHQKPFARTFRRGCGGLLPLVFWLLFSDATLQAGRWVAGAVAPQWIADFDRGPGPAGKLYASSSEGIFSSDDGGRSWVRIGDLPFDGRIRPDPIDPNVLYRIDYTFQRSTDGGRTWREVGQPADAQTLTRRIVWIAFSKTDPTLIYALGHDAGIFQSRDRGDTWTRMSRGLPVEATVLDLDARGSRLWAISTQGVHRSEDGGLNWVTPGVVPTPRRLLALAADPENTSTVFVGGDDGLFRSADRGATWSKLSLGDYPIHQIVFDPRTSATVFATSNPQDASFIFKSVDRGATWTLIREGLGSKAPIRLLFDAADPSHVWGGGFGTGLWESRDTGTTWTPLTLTNVTTLLIDPRNTKRLLAGTRASGFFRSEDGGRTWVALNRGLSGRETTIPAIRTALFHPGNPDVLWLGTSDGVYRSADQGASWTPSGLDRKIVRSLAVHPAAPDTLLAGLDRDGVARSLDGGRSWTPENSSFPIINRFYPSVSAIAFDRQSPQIAYAFTTSNGFVKSTDGGRTWTPKASGLVDEYGTPVGVPGPLVILPDGTLLGPGGPHGILESKDGGETWRKYGAPTLRSLFVSPSSPGLLYTSGGYIPLRSRDGGLTWEWAGGGLDTFAVHGHGDILAMDPSRPEIVYAVSDKAGIYRRDASVCFGDVNDDGWIDIRDIQEIFEHIRGRFPLDGKREIAGDVNGDGRVDILDLTEIALFVEGAKTAPDCENRNW